MLIFEHSAPDTAIIHNLRLTPTATGIPEKLFRKAPPYSEMDAHTPLHTTIPEEFWIESQLSARLLHDKV